MNSTFSGHFGYRRLLRVTLPSIVMMIFTSIYCVTDGFFVSNFAGKAAFTAVNFIMPYLMILGCASCSAPAAAPSSARRWARATENTPTGCFPWSSA